MLYASSEGSDDLEGFCGFRDSAPCNSVEFTVKIANEYYVDNIHLKASTFSPLDSIIIENYGGIIYGEGIDNTMLSTEKLPSSSSLFTVISGSLCTSLLSVILYSSNVMSSSLFVIKESGEKLSLNTTLLFASEAQQPFVEAFSILHSTSQTPSPTFGGCFSFSSYQSSLENLKVTDSTFSECCVSSNENGGKGGGIYLNYSHSPITPSFCFSSVAFNDNKGWIGRDIYLECHNLAENVNEESFAFAHEILQKNNSLFGKDLDGMFQGEDVDLFIFLEGFEKKTVFISSDSEVGDVKWCGVKCAPCLTLEIGLSHLAADESLNHVVLSGSIQIMECGIDVTDCEICGSDNHKDDEANGIEFNAVLSGIEIYAINGINLSLKDMAISFISNLQNENSYDLEGLVCSKGDLNITTCTFSCVSPSESIKHSLILAEEGSVKILNVLFENNDQSISFEVPAFIFSNVVTSANVEKLSVNNIAFSSDGLFKFSSLSSSTSSTFTSIPSVTVINSTFQSITSNSDSPALLSTLDYSAHCINICLDNVIIEGCSNENSDQGGCIGLEFINNRCFSLKNNSNLSGCSCSGTKGKGGAIFLTCSEEHNNFSLVDIEFSENNAFLGSNLYLFCKDLTETVNRERFQISLEEWKEDSKAFVGDDSSNFVNASIDLMSFLISFRSNSIIVNGVDGLDVNRCGNEKIKCFSLNIGVQHITFAPSQSDTTPSGNILIESLAIVKSCIDISDCAVRSSNESQAKIEFLEALSPSLEVPPQNEAVLSNCKALSFESVAFIVPPSFSSPYKALIFSMEGNTSLKSCSLKMNQGHNERIEFPVMKVQSGSFYMEKFSISDLKFTVSPIIISNIESDGIIFDSSFENLLLNGALVEVEDRSISFFSNRRFNKLSNSFSCSFHDNSYASDSELRGSEIEMIWCTMKKLTGDGEGSSILNSLNNCGASVIISDCVLSECKNERAEKGGSIKYYLLSSKYQGMKMLSVNGTSLTSCSCSTTNGRGGGVYIEGIYETAKSEKEKFLPVVFENVRFRYNDAYVGRDVFIKCKDLQSEVGEALFKIDLSSLVFDKRNAIYGRDFGMNENEPDVDLMDLITFFSREQVFANISGENGNRCGTLDAPCRSLDEGVRHVGEGLLPTLFIVEVSSIENEMTVDSVRLKPKEESCMVRIFREIQQSSTRDSIIQTEGKVEIESIKFIFPDESYWKHLFLIGILKGKLSVVKCSFEGEEIEESYISGSLFTVKAGVLAMSEIILDGLKLKNNLITCENGARIELNGIQVENIHSNQLIMCKSCNAVISRLSVIAIHMDSNLIICDRMTNLTLKELVISDLELDDGNVIEFGNENSAVSGEGSEINGMIYSYASSFCNVSHSKESNSILKCEKGNNIHLLNNSFAFCSNTSLFGGLAYFSEGTNISLDACLFDAYDGKSSSSSLNSGNEDICTWNGSCVFFEKCVAELKDCTITNSSVGGMSVAEGDVEIRAGNFTLNKVSNENYPSARRNIICKDAAVLNMIDLKGGDGLMPNTSLWILNEGCNLKGIPLLRDSEFFIPTLISIDVKVADGVTSIAFNGKLLLPCDLSCKLIFSNGQNIKVEKYDFSVQGFVNESLAICSIDTDIISISSDVTEISACIVFGKTDLPSSTVSLIVKNRTVPQSDEGNIVKGGNGTKPSWLLILIILLAVILLIVLIVSIIFIVRWRKAKDRTKELEIIVNDAVRKDPKLIEMVTMEPSPEEQWRRAEKVVEKKNEEMIKKRVYEKRLGHSESSEHLLSESGSTEYILGRDSSKIPDWALENAEEDDINEEIRKRSPSPSISSTSSTSSTDTDSTFVPRESMCPTTSSMSNLVDAMACSSPHEKLIVDLRDSLFMLLHGMNEKKEMAIGSLKEREQTAAQVLFWVANGALHSFENEADELFSLVNLSPHIVLFSEHMVITIALHSDCSSLDDSDSSSISSSSTLTTSSSDCSLENRNGKDSPPPSSAFEDEDDDRKECMRWKAPELMINNKMKATEKSVAFSIGMMLWECLTLEIPFGEYEAEAAGQKIVNGERPISKVVLGNKAEEVIELLVSQEDVERPGLVWVKRVCIQNFPKGAAVLTLSDAIDFVTDEDEEEEEDEGEDNDDDEEEEDNEEVSTGRKEKNGNDANQD
ncbi:uncharacterized protein MONOS_11310 [Monocercomonoides exilis]|uniref:uncharacterized protein n=1 Tax=Monocercomonoides exilis TaxID=2049356 RepID=UPI00355A03FC|nr:hypothetical protein MONOS_11310 [Monocercomonoides exilis]|eukprot:MONOS_11310.1-p1 / transcript=MONOS_11310.1 / gene=MONOS_11310 / organism=Monocercomonoides_exilis_PA203 / gene_product=unspecified product / transcript_product=unspecified product / location=Mono_scaffold00561:18475-25113(-) / protein_length=2139 / sequence_SO=supercontig / SO=protein_coding / is_pseudo=false